MHACTHTHTHTNICTYAQKHTQRHVCALKSTCMVHAHSTQMLHTLNLHVMLHSCESVSKGSVALVHVDLDGNDRNINTSKCAFQDVGVTPQVRLWSSGPLNARTHAHAHTNTQPSFSLSIRLVYSSIILSIISVFSSVQLQGKQTKCQYTAFTHRPDRKNDSCTKCVGVNGYKKNDIKSNPINVMLLSQRIANTGLLTLICFFNPNHTLSFASTFVGGDHSHQREPQAPGPRPRPTPSTRPFTLYRRRAGRLLDTRWTHGVKGFWEKRFNTSKTLCLHFKQNDPRLAALIRPCDWTLAAQ